MSKTEIQAIFEEYRLSLKRVSAKQKRKKRNSYFEGLRPLFPRRPLLMFGNQTSSSKFRSLIYIITAIDQIEPATVASLYQDTYQLLTAVTVTLTSIAKMLDELVKLSEDHKRLLRPASFSRHEIYQLNQSTYNKAIQAFKILHIKISSYTKESAIPNTPISHNTFSLLLQNISTMQTSCESRLRKMTYHSATQSKLKSAQEDLSEPLLPTLFN